MHLDIGEAGVIIDHGVQKAHPGSLIHVDVTKFGRIPDGGGHRFVGRQQGMKHRAATSDREGTRDARYQPRLGVGFLHTVIDDHSRFAYVEMHSEASRV